VALPAFAAVRRAAPCCCGAGRAAIDRYLLPAGHSAANPPHAAAAIAAVSKDGNAVGLTSIGDRR